MPEAIDTDITGSTVPVQIKKHEISSKKKHYKILAKGLDSKIIANLIRNCTKFKRL
jgi:hypothetical protein